MKKYKLALVMGRYGHFTLGHDYLVSRAIEESEAVLVLIGSSQESGTFRNPFSIHTRMDVVECIYPEESTNVFVGSMPDMTDERDISAAWGRHVLHYANECIKQFKINAKIDAMFYGHDEDRRLWFDPADIEGIEMRPVTRGIIDISATQMRIWMARNEYDSWKQFAHVNIHAKYDQLRQELLLTKEYWQLASAADRTNIEVLFETKRPNGVIHCSMLRKSLPNGVKWFYTHNNWCNAAGVAVLPYRIKDDQTFEYFGRYERCPAHSNNLELGCVMGGYDKPEKLSLAGHAVMELEEEAGYITSEKHLIYLGTTRPEKSSDTTHYLYAINVDAPYVTHGVAIGDGTITEEDAYCGWVDEKTAAYCKSPLFGDLVLRLHHHLGLR